MLRVFSCTCTPTDRSFDRKRSSTCGLIPVDLDLAPCDGTRDQERSRLDAVAEHRVLGRVHLLDPVDAHVDDPAPSISAPMLIRNLHRSTISGSRATFSRVVVPSAMHRRHEQVLGGTHARIVEEHVDGPQPRGRHLHETVVGADRAPHVGQPAQVDVDLAGTKVAAPRHGHPGPAEAGDQRTHDLDGGAHALDQLVRGHLGLHRRWCPPSWCRPRTSTAAPRCSSTSCMVCTSSMSGTLCSTLVPDPSSEAAISLRAEFLAPETATCPTRRRPPRTSRRGSSTSGAIGRHRSASAATFRRLRARLNASCSR